MRSDLIHPGDVIAGKYRVRTILGRSHGLLVEAFHTEFDQRVVVKVLLSGHGDDREIERFRREARTLSKLESEHAARIIDVGTEEDGSFYLVRQYLDGVDLATYVRQHGALSVADAVLTILMAAEAVAETHSHGIIVRELQPQHLFLTQRAGGAPLVKISDFGTAKLMKDAVAPGVGGEVTATAMFGLSPYSSPELVRKARNVDVRTDVWSLGAVFYELLTGRPPFGGEAAFLMLQITKEEPVPASQLRPGIPPEIDQIIGWALAKDVDARFKSVHAFAHALLPFASPEGQVLVERIAQTAEAAKRRRNGSLPPPSFLSAPQPAAPYSERPETEDSVTELRVDTAKLPSFAELPQHPGPAPQPHHPVVVPPQTRPRSLPPPPAGQPVGALPSQLAEPVASSPPVAAPSAPAPVMTAGRKAALASIAFVVVLLPILIVLLVLKKPAAPATAEAGSAAAVTASAPAVTAAAPLPSAPPIAAPPPAPAPPAATDVPSAAASDPPVASEAPKRASRPVRIAAAPVSQPAAASPSSGASGTLLAVAVGGSCAFSVNGASKGTSSSIRVSLKPGTYSVICKPPADAMKSKSVTVKSGETAMAAFKL